MNSPAPPALEVGNLTFRNWKKTDSGSLNFADALTQSCNTWFYQCGIKTGAAADYRLALRSSASGSRTGIPLNARSGRPGDER